MSDYFFFTFFWVIYRSLLLYFLVRNVFFDFLISNEDCFVDVQFSHKKFPNYLFFFSLSILVYDRLKFYLSVYLNSKIIVRICWYLPYINTQLLSFSLFQFVSLFFCLCFPSFFFLLWSCSKILYFVFWWILIFYQSFALIFFFLICFFLLYFVLKMMFDFRSKKWMNVILSKY